MTQSSPRHRSGLIVEDEPLCALDLEAHMHELGFHSCHLVANGQEAFVQAMSNQPDIVLMDVNLEGSREGIEVAKKLREACEARIVFVTGYTDPDDPQRGAGGRSASSAPSHLARVALRVARRQCGKSAMGRRL